METSNDTFDPFDPNVEEESVFDIPDLVCSVCSTEKTIDEMFTLSCKPHHVVCFECLQEQFSGFPENGSCPMCPFCSDEEYFLKPDEYACVMCSGDASDPEFEHYSTILSDYYAKKNNRAISICCCNPACGLLLPVSSECREVCRDIECPKCHTCTCTICEKLAHYSVGCLERDAIELKYNQWKSSIKYDRMIQRQESKGIFQDWKAKKEEFEKEAKRVKDNYEALKSDESRLASTSRYCPKCNRVIQKLSGCDMMICGQNFHGGDVQSGCGTHFNWSEAKRYQPIITKETKMEFKDDLPDKDNYILHDKQYRCCLCGSNQIVGIRFKCINCKAQYFCEDCEYDRIKEHFGGKHILKLITNPSES
ncbi:hypothetical protein WA158_007554 [Blastocystis sp. Blastoise]